VPLSSSGWPSRFAIEYTYLTLLQSQRHFYFKYDTSPLPAQIPQDIRQIALLLLLLLLLSRTRIAGSGRADAGLRVRGRLLLRLLAAPAGKALLRVRRGGV